MTDRAGPSVAEAWEWRRGALVAAGVVGMWEWDHRGETARYCPGVATLMTGDPSLAWRDLSPRDAFAGIEGADAERLRAQMTEGLPDLGARACEVRVRGGAVRRILCRGRTTRGADGAPEHTRGIMIDAAEGCATSAALDAAAEHGLAAYEAIEASGVRSLAGPARALLMAVGREIARRL